MRNAQQYPECEGPSSAPRIMPPATFHPAPSADWPFHRLAAERREAFQKIDADVATWKQQAETLWCDAVNSGAPADIQVLRAHLERVVAVRA